MMLMVLSWTSAWIKRRSMIITSDTNSSSSHAKLRRTVRADAVDTSYTLRPATLSPSEPPHIVDVMTPRPRRMSWRR